MNRLKNEVRRESTMKTVLLIAAVISTAANFAFCQIPKTNAVPSPPREGDNVPAPGPRERAYGISGPGQNTPRPGPITTSNAPARR